MLSIESVITILQFLLFLGPVLGYFVAKRICLPCRRRTAQIVLHGYESGRIVRLPGGEYIEVHEPVDEYERWKLVSFSEYEPLMIRPNAAGRIPVDRACARRREPLVLRGPHRAGDLHRARGRASPLIYDRRRPALA